MKIRIKAKMILNILGLFFICATVNAKETIQQIYTIPLDKPITTYNRELYINTINVTRLSTTQFNFVNVTANVSFIIFQAHSHLYNITMYNNTYAMGSYVTGKNVGLYSSVDSMYTFYIMNQNEQDLNILIAINGYGDSDPIPGGCNIEDISTAPYLQVKLSQKKEYLNVIAGSPRAPLRAGTDIDKCYNSQFVKMDFYRIYLPERDFSEDTYFEGIRAMMNYDSIIENGKLIYTTSVARERRTLSAYPGTASVFVVVATIKIQPNATDIYVTYYSVYVPIVTYACSPLIDTDCDLLVKCGRTGTFTRQKSTSASQETTAEKKRRKKLNNNILSEILCASLLFVGIFVCYFGHRFFKTEMFIFGMLSGVIITYILIPLIAEMEQTPLMGASFLSGILFGFIWLTFWWFYGMPVFSVLLTTLNFGFFAGGVLFNQLPGGIVILKEDANFWTIFITIVLVTSITLSLVTYPGNILCCAILGAYAAIFPIDYYLGSNLKYIIINTVRRATVVNFNLAVLSPPFQNYDAMLTLLWVMLATTGFLYQHYHNRGKPPFPPPPRSVRERPEVYNYGTSGIPYIQVTSELNPAFPQADLTNERTPLLS